MSRFKRRKSTPNDELDATLLRHIKTLGLSSVAEYRNWCSENGFSCKLNKSWTERCRERYAISCNKANKCLKQRRRESKNPRETLIAICNRELRASDLVQPHLKLLARRVAKLPVPSHREAATRNALARLFEHTFNSRSGFFHESPVISQLGRQKGNTYIEALVTLATRSPDWRNAPAAWKARSKNTRRQFQSLVRHLFCDYSMPRFFDSVWFLGDGVTARRQQDWYIHIGKGGSIRDRELPIPYTRRMGHFFMHAPDDLTVPLAIRWGQLKTLGFTTKQLRALLEVRQSQSFEHNDFWLTVYRWLSKHDSVDSRDYGPLIDFIHNQRFVPERQVFGREDYSPEPPQPNFTMKRRDPAILLRQMHEWHKQLASDNTSLEATWRRSGFPEFDFQEGQGQSRKQWTIRELLSREALVIEGRKMNHCVASYSQRCKSGGGSIWTMEVETIGGRKKLLTIEVQNSSGRIVQARGKANRRAKPQEVAILRRWTTETGLTLGVE